MNEYEKEVKRCWRIKIDMDSLKNLKLLKEAALEYIDEHYEDDSEEISQRVTVLCEIFGLYRKKNNNDDQDDCN